LEEARVTKIMTNSPMGLKNSRGRKKPAGGELFRIFFMSICKSFGNLKYLNLIFTTHTIFK
jgi:hypothetical protein